MENIHELQDRDWIGWTNQTIPKFHNYRIEDILIFVGIVTCIVISVVGLFVGIILLAKFISKRLGYGVTPDELVWNDETRRYEVPSEQVKARIRESIANAAEQARQAEIYQSGDR